MTSPADELLSGIPRSYMVFFGSIFLLMISALIAAGILGIGQLLIGNLAQASDYASIAAGLATVVLVTITAWYAYETRQLVRETEKARREDLRQREKELLLDKDKLRRALLQEIRAVDDLHEISRNYHAGYSRFQQIVPSQVYEANADDIGLLTEEEIEIVVEYHTLAEIVNDHLVVQRKLDTQIDRNLFEQMYHVLSLRGWLFRSERKQRSEVVAERIGELAEAQSEAVMQLKFNLKQDREIEKGFGASDEESNSQ